MSWAQVAAQVLTHERVVLRRVRVSDRDRFARIVFDDSIWRYFVSRIATEDDLDGFLETAIRDTLNGTRIVFAIVERARGTILGSTAYGNLAESEHRIEIGWSWVAPAHRRTGVNRIAKLLLLDHAFDVLGCARVEFKTDVLNTAARTALAGIGAREEGVLRSFNYMPGGRRRDVVYYSILRDEWPVVRRERFAALATAAA